MSGTRVGADDGRLTTELAASLEPHLQDALNHPLRREILRVLRTGEGSRGVTAILGGLAPLSRSDVSYHLEILRSSDVVVLDDVRPGPAGGERFYESTVREDAQVAAALRATAAFDREHREARRADRSSRLLTMFRVPKPVRTLRLGLDAGSGTER